MDKLYKGLSKTLVCSCQWSIVLLQVTLRLCLHELMLILVQSRTQEEMAHTCRGTINLAGACIDTIDATHFVITNGPSQVYDLTMM